MDAVILAGGAGTRLRSLVQDVPKPMAEVGGRPFLEYLLDHLAASAVERVILSVGYRRDVIMRRFGGRFRHLPIAYAVEEEPLGTGGAIRRALALAAGDPVAVLNGDTFFPVDLAAMSRAHLARGRDVTLALKALPRPGRYGLVERSGDRIIRFAERGGRDAGEVNGGVYLVRRTLSAEFPPQERFSFERDFLARRVEDLHVGGWVSDAWFVDIGVPDDYRRAQRELPEQARSAG